MILLLYTINYPSRIVYWTVIVYTLFTINEIMEIVVEKERVFLVKS